MPRFFIDMPLAAGDSLPLPEAVVRHIQVLRLQTGDALTLFNGDGAAFDAKLTALGKKHASVDVFGVCADDGSEPPYRIELIQGIASNEKMDWLIEKAVELGVHRIVPIAADRSVVRLHGERRQRRHQHWIALTRAACEQCGRNRVPDVAEPIELDTWLASVRGPSAQVSAAMSAQVSASAQVSTAAASLKLLLSPRGTRRFDTLLPATPPSTTVQLLIGPEGGWSENEETMALAAGYQPLSLGARVLRTETAGMAVLAALAARWHGW